MSHWRENYKHILTFPKAFWIVIIATLCNQIGNMAFVFLLLYLTNYLHFSITQASIIFATVSAAMFMAGIFGGGLIDHFGCGKTMMYSLIANGFTLLILPSFHHYAALLIIAGIWGAAYGLYRPASSSFISLLAPKGGYKLTFSVYRLVMNLGMSIGPAIGGYLASYSYPAIFIVNGLANFLASAVLAIGLSKVLWEEVARDTNKKFELSLKFIKRDRALRIFVFGMIPISMVFFQHESTLAIYITDNLQLPISLYGWLFTINTLIIVGCELPLNVATMHWPYRVNFMLGCMCITLGFFGLLFANQAWQIIILAIAWTVGEMLFYPSASSYIAEIAPSRYRGSYMALYSTCSNIGMMLGPLLGALIMQRFTAQWLWLLCAVAGAASILIYTQLIPPAKEKR